jgi:hypothetical protein
MLGDSLRPEGLHLFTKVEQETSAASRWAAASEESFQSQNL